MNVLGQWILNRENGPSLDFYGNWAHLRLCMVGSYGARQPTNGRGEGGRTEGKLML